MQSGLFGKTSTAIPVIHNVGKIACAELFAWDEELASALVAEHYESLFVAGIIGHRMADDLEKKSIVFAKLLGNITRIILLKARITADAVSAVAVVFLEEIEFRVLEVIRTVFKACCFQRGINDITKSVVA